MLKAIAFIILLASVQAVKGQSSLSTMEPADDTHEVYELTFERLIIPAASIVYGFTSLRVEGLKNSIFLLKPKWESTNRDVCGWMITPSICPQQWYMV